MNNIELDNKYSTYNEILDNGLRTEKEVADIMTKHNYSDKSKRKYLNMKGKYFNLFENKLLEIGYDFSEARDIFNYCFKDWYYKNVPSNSKRKRVLVIEDFLNSLTFERFVMTQNTVSGLGESISRDVLGFWEPVNVNANSLNPEDIY